VRSSKKDVHRAFVRFIAEMLETHRFDDWLNDKLIAHEDIETCADGGNMNRLYQLLAQGRARNLELTSYILEAAAMRHDWFNAKQKKALNMRADLLRQEEIEAEAIEEEEERRDEAIRERMAAAEREAMNPTAPPVEAYVPEETPAELDFKNKAVALQDMTGADKHFNGRTGVVQPYDLEHGQWAVKLTTPMSDNRSAVTVFARQLRVLTAKEIKRAKEDQERFLRLEKKRRKEDALRSEQEAEEKDRLLALKLVEQFENRGGVDKANSARASAAAPAPAPSPAPIPTSGGVVHNPAGSKSTEGSKRFKGTIKTFAKGNGFITFTNPPKKNGKARSSKVTLQPCTQQPARCSLSR
jgi:hypothetical protein